MTFLLLAFCLTGTARAQAVVVGVSPAQITFPYQAVSTTSFAVRVMVNNYTSNAVALNSITISGDFAETSTCTSSLAGGSQCYVSVTFSPTTTGTRTGTLTVTNSTGSPFTVSLTGNGVPAGAGATITTISSSGSAGAYALTGTVTGTRGTGAPTGSVGFLDNSKNNLSLGTAPLGTSTVALSLANGTSNTTGDESSDVVVGDFNGDGKPDLAVLNNGNMGGCGIADFSVSIWLGNGDGTFTAGPAVPLNFCGAGIVAGDFNGDHNTDLAITGPSSLTVLFGNGNGTFTSQTSTLPSEGGSLAAGDFNGDGISDLAVISTNGQGVGTGVMVLLGQRSGTFAAGPTFSTPTPIGQGIVVADFNGDGKPDIAVLGGSVPSGNPPSQDITVGVALGNGDGTFQPLVSTDAGTALNFKASYQCFAAGDFNGDGNADLVIEGSLANSFSDGFLVLMGKGDGTFTVGTPFTILPQYGSNSGSVTTADFNDDGKSDIAVLNELAVQVWLSNGNGTFTMAASADSGAETSPDWLALATADFNGDGIPDFVEENSDAQAAILVLGQRSETATATVTGVSIPGSGSQNVTASYGGDANFSGSTSSAISLSGATSVTASLTITPSTGVIFNQTATLTATPLQTVQQGKWWITEDTTDLTNTSKVIAAGALPNISNGGFLTTTPPLTAGNHIFYAYYSATAPSGNQLPLSAVGGASITVGQATPTITWAAPAAITQGTPLSSAQLDATASVPGTFVYSPSSGTVLNAGQQTLTATFTPTDTTDYTTATASVTLTVNAATPAVTLSPTSLTFAAQNLGSTSAAQTITLTNSGYAALNITSIAASGDFAESNTCGSSVAAGANCAISVTFTPTAGGTRSGAVTITDNASGSPQSVALTGTGSTVTVSSTSSSLSIGSAGGSTTATVQLSAAGGFSGNVNLTCAVTYTGTGTASDAPTCSLNPTSAQVSAGSSVSTTLTVSTTSSSAQLGKDLFGFGGGTLTALLFFIAVPRRRWKRWTMLFILCLTVTGAAVGCGGGSSSSGSGTSNPGTTTGSYNVKVTATSGTTTASLTIPLSVQ